MPLKTEINPLPLMRKLADAGAQLALPVVAGRGKPLIMRAFAFGDALASGQWGIREPKADAPEVAPDILLVPLLAFDRNGHRIGYGAGYYDMTIAQISRDEADRRRRHRLSRRRKSTQVPVTPRDARLDLVLTEREVIDLRGSVNASSVRRRCGGAVGAYGRDRASARPQARLEARLRRSSTARTRPAASASPSRSTTR